MTKKNSPYSNALAYYTGQQKKFYNIWARPRRTRTRQPAAGPSSLSSKESPSAGAAETTTKSFPPNHTVREIICLLNPGTKS